MHFGRTYWCQILDLLSLVLFGHFISIYKNGPISVSVCVFAVLIFEVTFQKYMVLLIQTNMQAHKKTTLYTITVFSQAVADSVNWKRKRNLFSLLVKQKSMKFEIDFSFCIFIFKIFLSNWYLKITCSVSTWVQKRSS